MFYRLGTDVLIPEITQIAKKQVEQVEGVARKLAPNFGDEASPTEGGGLATQSSFPLFPVMAVCWKLNRRG